MRLIALSLLAACSSPPPPCAVSWSGNFVESAAGAAVCPTLSGQVLGFAIHSRSLGATLMIAIDLGAAPAPGSYSPATVGEWSAVAARGAGQGACEYAAGTGTTPGGTFTLELDVIDGAIPHGSLDVEQWVQAAAGTDCGAGDTELVSITF